MKVSIIVPVYNVEEYLKKCIDSLINQSFLDLEVVLVDDGSTDNSGLICDEYMKKDNRIKVFHKSNEGVSSARNLGLGMAQGDYIGFVDPDDWCEKNMYEQMYQTAISNSADLVICGYYVDYDDHNLLIETPKAKGSMNGCDALYECLKGPGNGCFTSVWNKLIRRSVIDNIRFETNYIISEDEFFLVEISNNVKNAVIIQNPLYHWYERRESAVRSKENYRKKWESAYEAKRKIVDILCDERCRELAKANIYNSLFSVVWHSYCFDDIKTMKDFSKKISIYKRCFFNNPAFSKRKKLKFYVLDILMRAHVPKSVIKAIGNTSTFKVKKYFQKIKLFRL